MRPGSFLILLIVTVAASVAAVAATMSERRADAVALQGERMFPGLTQRIERVDTIEVTAGGYRYALKRAGDGWVAETKHGYPVDEARVNRLLVGLANLERLEAKTKRPELYPHIYVEDPAREGARSRLVRLKDREGEVLAELIVGKQRHQRTGLADQGTYVREPGAARAWLGTGLIDLWDDERPWLKSRIADIPPGELKRIEPRPRDGPALIAVRPARDAEAMGIADVPDGAAPSVEKVRRLGSVLSGIRFDDVVPGGEIDFSDPVSRARITTFDGVALALEVARHDGVHWLRFDVGVAEEAEDMEAAKALAAEVAERLHGWAFRVQRYIAARLSQSLEDVLEEAGS